MSKEKELLRIRDGEEYLSARWYTANTDYENYMRKKYPNFKGHFDPDDDFEDEQ